MSEVVMKNCQHTLLVSDANLEGSRFSDVRLAQAQFREMTFEQSSFAECSFEQTSWRRISFSGTTFEEVSLMDVQIRKSRYEGMTIDGISVVELLEVYRATRAA